MKRKSTIRKYTWRVSLAGALIAILAVVVLSNLNLLSLGRLSGTTDAGSSAIVTATNISEQIGSYRVSIQVPIVTGLSDKSAEDAINAKMRELAERTKQKTSASPDVNDKPVDNAQKSVTQTFEVITSTSRMLTIAVHTVKFPGNTSSSEYDYFNIDLTHNRLLSLDQLFQPGYDYITVISDSIKEQMANKEKTGYSYYSGEEQFKSILPDQDFYLDANGQLTISFDKYEISPGNEQFVIPHSVIQAGLQ